MNNNLPCPCYSGKSYISCCEKLHLGSPAKTALSLMRARYAAYALDLPIYIIETTHKSNPQYSENKIQWEEEIHSFSSSHIFKSLEILDDKEEENRATVTFIAHLSQDKKEASFTEKSLFKKENGFWLYLSGIILKS